MARAGDAYIARDDSASTWTIANGQLSATFRVERDHALQLLHLVNPVTHHAWEAAAAADTVSVVADQTAQLGVPEGGYQLADVSGTATDKSVHLVIAFLQRASNLRVTRHYMMWTGVPAIETWTRYEAQSNGEVEVSDLNVWQFTVTGQQVEWINGLRGDGMNAVVNDAFSVQGRTLGPGDEIDLGSHGRSSESEVPYFKIVSGGEALVGGLLWSGAWNLTLVGRPAGTEFTLDLGWTSTTVTPTRPVETPHGFLAVADKAELSSRAIDAYVRNAIRGGRGFDTQVTYNTWFAYGTRIDEQMLRAEMERTAELGTELFVVDAGWYANAGREGVFDFTTGLGDWHSDPSRFPSGLAALSDYAHSLGMRFGLWVEPERIALEMLGGGGPDESWLATVDGLYDPDGDGRPRAAQLCFASDRARAWILGEIERLIDQVHPDYLKWDNNFWVNCNRSGHGHGYSDGNFAHVKALYDVLATLRARYPAMRIENVSGGGNRLDYGMLRFTEVGWMDDRTAPSVHVRHNFQGLGTALPPSYLFSFVIDHDDESLARGNDIPLYMRSRMTGVLGLTFRTAELRQSTSTEIANHIQLYKQLRGTIQQGSAMMLTAQASVNNPPAWDAVQVTDGSGQSLVFAFQVDQGTGRLTLNLRGLKPDALYDVRSVDAGPLGQATGAELMASGVELTTTSVSAAHVLIVTEK